MYTRPRGTLSVRKKPCRIGSGLCELRRTTLLRGWVNRGEEEGSEREASEHHKRLRHQREGAEKRGGVLSEDAAPFWFGYSTVASLGASEEWALRLSSATRRASSSSLDLW